MITNSIKLTQYRNYVSTQLHFHPKFNAMVGLNGMGKTNILDALYYLCLGKSYFSSSDRHVVTQGMHFFRIEGNFELAGEISKVVIKSQNGIKKEIEVAGKKLEKIGDLVGQFLAVIIAPSDIQTMLEGSEDRRNFLNNSIVQTDRSYLHDLFMYNHLLKQRNALLKSFAEQKKFDKLLLDAISQGMFGPGERIFERRKAQVAQMQPIFEETYQEISGGNEKCQIIYQSQLYDGGLDYLMETTVEKDRILGRTTSGIHKDDLVFTMNGEWLKNFASQGQLKSFVLSLKLAQYKLLEANSGNKPILLLDDIFDKLDQERVKHLLSMLMENNFGQVFITDTHKDRIHKILQDLETECRTFVVDKGTIIQNTDHG